MREREVVALPIRLDHVVLDDPVDFGVEGQRVVLEPGHRVLPHAERLLLERREAAPLGEPESAVQVLGLDLDRRQLAPVGQPHPAATREVVADLADGADRVLEREVAPGAGVLLEHPQHDRRRADLEERRVLAHVGVADDHEEAPEAFGVGVGLVPGVDDRS